MSSIGNISGVNNLSYLQPTTSAPQRVAGSDSGGDSDSRGGAGGVGQSNFISAIAQALGQSLSVSSATATASFNSFLHRLDAEIRGQCIG